MCGEVISGEEVGAAAVARMVVGRSGNVGFIGGGCVMVGVAAVTEMVTFFALDVSTKVLYCGKELVAGDTVEVFCRVSFIVAEELLVGWEVEGTGAAVVVMRGPLLVGGKGGGGTIVFVATTAVDVFRGCAEVLVAGGGRAEVEAASDANVVIG